jgi:DNA-binding response OmpR family regulator
MQQHTLLIASADQEQRDYLATQLVADGHTVYDTDTVAGAIAKLSTHAIDVMLLGALERPADSLALLRAIHAGEHRRIHPDQPVITLGADDEISMLRAYEAGSDHHLADDTSYLLLRAVLHSIARRLLGETDARYIHVGALQIDTAARTARVNGTLVTFTRIEYALLLKLASDPTKVLTKDDLARTIWGSTGAQVRSRRSVDSHVARLRHRLRDAGAEDLITTCWGLGWALTTPES